MLSTGDTLQTQIYKQVESKRMEKYIMQTATIKKSEEAILVLDKTDLNTTGIARDKRGIL